MTGTYTLGEGTAQGRAQIGVLRLTWSQPDDKGTARLRLSADGKSFTGTSKSDGQKKDHSWNSTRR